ncbi:MAG: hypothetical protein WB676_03420 [Bryobacteraceae bacterium]
MKRVFACPLLFAILTATSILAQSNGYDVRKERWGMSQKDVIAAEGREPYTNVGNVLLYRDEVAGITARVGFLFDENKLFQVRYWPWDQSTLDDVESAFHAWLTALHRRYGYNEGYLFVGKETVSKTTSLERINSAVEEIKKGNISEFQVQFTDNDRSLRPSLIMERSEDKSLHVRMEFTMRPPDNF